MKCNYDEDKCPKCGSPMSQIVDDDFFERCSNKDCDFIHEHCGECSEYNPPCLSHYWDGNEFVRI